MFNFLMGMTAGALVVVLVALAVIEVEKRKGRKASEELDREVISNRTISSMNRIAALESRTEAVEKRAVKGVWAMDMIHDAVRRIALVEARLDAKDKPKRK